jgi:hypothetical protein
LISRLLGAIQVHRASFERVQALRPPPARLAMTIRPVSDNLGGVGRLRSFGSSRSSRGRGIGVGRSRTSTRRSGSAAASRSSSTRTTAAALVTVMTPAVATTARRGRSRSSRTRATTATVMAEGRRRLFTAHEGNRHDCEEDRNAKNQRAIHLRILLQGTGTFGSQTKHTPSYVLTPTVTASNWAKPQHVRLSQAVGSFAAEAALSVSLCRLKQPFHLHSLGC